MTDRTMYIYTRPDGGTNWGTEQPVGIEYRIGHRLIADEGMVLTDGEVTTPCVDTEEPERWSEVPEPEVEE